MRDKIKDGVQSSDINTNDFSKNCSQKPSQLLVCVSVT